MHAHSQGFLCFSVLPVSNDPLCACSDFGPKVVQAQLIMKSLPALFEAKQVPVRDGMKKLVVRRMKSLYSMLPFISPQSAIF